MVYKSCRFACVAKEVASHLKEGHISIRPGDRKNIANNIRTIANIIQDQDSLSEFKFPPPTTDPIPFIAPPENDGLRCKYDSCDYMTRTEYGMRAHCRKNHRWISQHRKGSVTVQREKGIRECLWTMGVRC